MLSRPIRLNTMSTQLFLLVLIGSSVVFDGLTVGFAPVPNFPRPKCHQQNVARPIRMTATEDPEAAVEGGSIQPKPFRVAIVGGGWAGFSAAEALSQAGSANGGGPVEVTLLDASPRGRGGLAGGWRTEKLGRPVEAGLHGFWRDYRNTFATIEGIENVVTDEILTPYNPSVLVSESGRVAVAPVLGAADDGAVTSVQELLTMDNLRDPNKFLQALAGLLPPPLDVALLSDFDNNSPLTVADRISAVGLLAAWADFGQQDPDSWDRYDKVSAEELFLSIASVSPTLYRELVSPLLHVLPMTPGYDCSAAAALSCFHVFALQSRGAFDVRWCRGTIAESIFNPWSAQLTGRGVDIRGSARVTAMTAMKDGTYRIVVNDDTAIDADAIVMAVGGTAMKKLLPACPPLQMVSGSTEWNNFRGVTCVAVRLFLKPHTAATMGLKGGIRNSTHLPPLYANAMRDSPVFVCGPRIIPKLGEVGFCLYDLERLHDEFDGSDCAALEVDFFRADALAAMESDDEVVEIVLEAVAAALGIPVQEQQQQLILDDVLDMSVVRARNAVSHFCVGSASWSPDVRLNQGLYICGDWIDRKGHASWSTEKAVVTGKQAVGALAKDFGLEGCQTDVIPVVEDTPQLSLLRKAAKTVRDVLPGDAGLPAAPWTLAQRLTRGRL